ncbi:MAG: iron-binding protein [Helicobacteraceae bacterium]|jgi:rubrerythrin|nr:iron-binding protein [Helicobacteraceae bacterium]
MSKLYQVKHELWLDILYASFATGDKEIKDRLYDFSMIAFRHMKWLGESLLEAGSDYNYDRTKRLQKRRCTFDLFNDLIKEVKTAQQEYNGSTLISRIVTDENYFVEYLTLLLADSKNNHKLTAFDLHRTLPNKKLDTVQTHSLTMFLFEESYKEYELILVYAYMQARTDNLLHFNVFQDLIDESHFHLKSFGNMMAQMGILALPRELHELTYKITDISQFIVNGIKEEENAKEQCRALAEAVNDTELSQFFDFINYQENYHIELMTKLLPESI